MENQKIGIIALVAIIIIILGGFGLFVIQGYQVNSLRQDMASAVARQSLAIDNLSSQIGELKTQKVDNQDGNQSSGLDLATVTTSSTSGDVVSSPSSDSRVTIQDIRLAFARKYTTRDYSKSVITINQNSGTLFAQGTIGSTNGGGGVYWAAKVSGVWTIVFDGQDTPACSILKTYNFPAVFTTGCFTPATSVTPTDIKNAFIRKYPTRDYTNSAFTIVQNSGNLFVQGAVNGTSGSGGVYWAAKSNGVWTIVFDGQDTPPCKTLKAYSFPAEFTNDKGDCY